MNKIERVFIVVAITVSLLVGCFSLLQFNAPRVAQAESVSAYQTVTLLQATAITQPLTATGIYLAAYGVADCYSMIGANTVNTATVYLQHGPNNSKWVDLYAFDAALANSISFTHTALYGNYTRAWVNLASTDPITLVVQCIAKNIQQ